MIMGKHVVGRASEIPPGGRRIVEAEGRSIGVFNVNGVYYALRNSCPHQQAPLCRSTITGTTLPSKPGEYLWAREGEILRCPWHGWKFDITNGRSIFNPHRMRVKTYEVTVEAIPDTPEAPQEDPSVESYTVLVEEELV